MFELSVKALGELNLEDFCPRCFWLKYHYPLKEKHPHYQHFPRIFNDIDLHLKNVIQSAFKNFESFPWLREIIEAYNITGIRESKELATKLGKIILKGRPDMVFRVEEGEALVVDFKTAKFTEIQKKLFPLYEAQLNGYAYLLERSGLKVKHLALVYLEPITSLEHPAFKLEFYEERPILPFDFTIINVEKWDKEKVIDLIKKAEIILSREEPQKA